MKKSSLKTNVTVILLTIVVLLTGLPSLAGATVYSDNLVPVMTSNTAPSGKASASVSNSIAYLPFSDSGWIGWRCYTEGWLEYEFPSPKTVTKFRIGSYWNDAYAIPLEFNFEAFNETSGRWDILKSVKLSTPSGEYESTIDNVKSYKRYRLNIFAWSPDWDCGINEFKMYETLYPPAKPLNLTASAGNAKVNLSWDAVDKATHYIVKRADASNGSYEEIATVTSNSFEDTSVVNGTTYYYKIIAQNEAGQGPDSDVIAVTPIWPKILISINSTTYTQDFDCTIPKAVKEINFNLDEIPNAYLPTSFNVEGYNETNSQWESISSDGTVAFGSNELILNNTKAYKKYRLSLTFDRSSAVSLTISEVYGTD